MKVANSTNLSATWQCLSASSYCFFWRNVSASPRCFFCVDWQSLSQSIYVIKNLLCRSYVFCSAQSHIPVEYSEPPEKNMKNQILYAFMMLLEWALFGRCFLRATRTAMQSFCKEAPVSYRVRRYNRGSSDVKELTKWIHAKSKQKDTVVGSLQYKPSSFSGK